MPGRDGTGPLGLGPATGWGRGPCGRGLRRGAWGAGYGRGYGRGWNYPTTKENELNSLKREKELMENELENIRKRMEELSK